MDLVVPLWQSMSGEHPDLQVALRSYPGTGEVWILGGKPKWLVNVNHVPIVQNGGRYQNTRKLLRWAVASPLVSDPFLWSNDDIFWLGTETPMLHGGPFAKYVMRLSNSYARGGRETLKMLRAAGYSDPLSWSLHTPLVVHKEQMRYALDMAGNLPWAVHVRTLYGNLAEMKGTQHRDVKLHGAGLPDPSWPYVSTSDEAFTRHPVGKWLRDRFPDPSRFERT